MLILGLIDTASTWGDEWGKVAASAYLGYTPTILGSIVLGIWGFVSAGIWGLIGEGFKLGIANLL